MFGNKKNLLRLQGIFDKLKSKNHKIIILTRALESQVRQYLLLNGLYPDMIIGSVSIEESINPTLSKNERDYLFLDNDFNINPQGLWAMRKTSALLKLCANEQINTDEIIFFDDQLKNIVIARKYFRYVFHIRNSLEHTIYLVNRLPKFILLVQLAKKAHSDKKIKLVRMFKDKKFDRDVSNDYILETDHGMIFLRDLAQFNVLRDDEHILKRILDGDTFEFDFIYRKFISHSDLNKKLNSLFLSGGFYTKKAMKYRKKIKLLKSQI
jgi:hypothetical protein